MMSGNTHILPAQCGLADTRSLLVDGEAHLTNSTDLFRIDCSACDLLSSMTLGVVVKLTNQYRKQNRDVVLCGINPAILQALKTSSLIHILKVESGSREKTLDVASAIVSLSVDIDFEIYRDIGIFKFGGSMLSPHDSEIFLNMATHIIKEGFKMLIDMTDLVYIDSMGIGALIKAHKLMRQYKGEIRICSAGEILKELLVTQNLQTLIPLYENRDDALKSWS